MTRRMLRFPLGAVDGGLFGRVGADTCLEAVAAPRRQLELLRGGGPLMMRMGDVNRSGETLGSLHWLLLFDLVRMGETFVVSV